MQQHLRVRSRCHEGSVLQMLPMRLVLCSGVNSIHDGSKRQVLNLVLHAQLKRRAMQCHLHHSSIRNHIETVQSILHWFKVLLDAAGVLASSAFALTAFALLSKAQMTVCGVSQVVGAFCTQMVPLAHRFSCFSVAQQPFANEQCFGSCFLEASGFLRILSVVCCKSAWLWFLAKVMPLFLHVLSFFRCRSGLDSLPCPCQSGIQSRDDLLLLLV